MALATTEKADGRYRGLDLWPTDDVVSAVISVQQEALKAVATSGPAFSPAIEVLAGKLKAGGRMAYVGAGSSGMIAQMDALEMPGTFGIGSEKVPVILAGGPAALLSLAGSTEDDSDAGAAAVDELGLGPADALIAITASGSTPFTLAALRRAKARGVATVAIACAAGAPVLTECDYPILIETPPEVVAGSTRMGAGTAQKCALNILSTGVAIRLGHAFAGLMVNMKPDNAKLRHRAAAIVAEAADVSLAAAEEALEAADWSVKTAVMICLGRLDAEEARVQLARSGGDIRAALAHQSAA